MTTLKQGAAACAVLALTLAAGAASAQAAGSPAARTLADGRTITAAPRVSSCQPATVVADTDVGLHLQFACTVPSVPGSADEAGTGQLIILAGAGTVSPLAYLTTEAEGWWPGFASFPQAQKDNAISRSDKTTAGGPAPFLCLHRDNIDALDGDAICILDTPGVQVALIGKSGMALTADNVVDAMVAGMRIR